MYVDYFDYLFDYFYYWFDYFDYIFDYVDLCSIMLICYLIILICFLISFDLSFDLFVGVFQNNQILENLLSMASQSQVEHHRMCSVIQEEVYFDTIAEIQAEDFKNWKSRRDDAF